MVAERLIAGLLCLLALASQARADFCGSVVRVLDGDTIEVLVDRSAKRVRLAEVDAPEKAQPFGSAARDTLAALIAGREVLVHEVDVDRYGRVVGVVYLPSGTCVGPGLRMEPSANQAMVEMGMAWAYRRYVRQPGILQAEARARAARIGLWRTKEPIAPWDWRAAKQ
ncbi:thermonuclease family protein [Variovorax paradoxus]|uniref:thermonuclease family protein n=1 Tax=Variovorax paradoxus TaxID=34073 RepID=UPI001ABC7FBF